MGTMSNIANWEQDMNGAGALRCREPCSLWEKWSVKPALVPSSLLAPLPAHM